MNLTNVVALATRRMASLPTRVDPTPGPADMPIFGETGAAALLLLTANIGLRQQWVRWCTESGYCVWHSDHASEGLRAMSSVHIDLLVVDADLPQMGGCGMAEYVRAVYPAIRVVLAAPAFISDADDARMAHLGMPVVTDPGNRSSLVDTIRDELRLPQQ